MFNYLVNYFKALVPQKSKKGQALLEYGLIIALVGLATILILPGIGTKLANVFTQISGSL